MISKYLLRTFLLIISVLLFSSCLNDSNQREIEDLSKDAQIYNLAISSSSDTTRALSNSPFTIDQLSNRIFNKNPLPYQFNVDSVKMNLMGFSQSGKSFSKITIFLQNNDSSYNWNMTDSIAINRLKRITTTSLDGKQTKTYSFELNTYAEDPYVLNWEKLNGNYVTSTSVDAQKTILLKDQFITYYKSGTTLKAITSTNGTAWATLALAGLPSTTTISSFIVIDNVAYALDLTSKVYKTTDGINWSAITTPHPIIAIYGKLPLATKGSILTLVNNNGVATFAETNDFSSLNLLNAPSKELPVSNFSATQIDNPKVYSAKYILLSGGLNGNNAQNNSIWLLQEKDQQITYLPIPGTMSLAGSTVFTYNNNQYMIGESNGKNTLLLSNDYGKTWKLTGKNQEFPTDFSYRSNPSVIIDKDNYIWIFGGTSKSSTQLTDVWRGRLNILAQN